MTLQSRRAYAIWFKDLDDWAIRISRSSGVLPSGWARKRIAEIVDLIETKQAAKPETTYAMTGVRWYGQGVFLREEVKGKEMSASYVYRVVPNALIYNRLFAWKGSFAVVPEDIGEQYASNEFPQFLCKSNLVLPEYLFLVCMTDSFNALVNQASTGSAAVSRNRLRESKFLNFEIVLPPLETQRAIVRRWQEGQAEAERLEARAQDGEKSVDAVLYNLLGIEKNDVVERPKVFAISRKDLERWSFDAVFSSIMGLDKTLTSNYPYKLLGEISTVSYGIQKSPANRPGQHARPYLRVANVRKGFLDLHEIKEINVPDSELNTYSLLPGDILFVEGNGSRAELGRVAVWNGEIENCVHQNHLIKVRTDKTVVLPEYIMGWFNSEVGRSHFFRSAKTSSGLGTINSSEVRSAPIPLPPLETQRDIVRQVQAVRQEAAARRGHAGTIRKDTKIEVEHLILGTKSVSFPS